MTVDNLRMYFPVKSPGWSAARSVTCRPWTGCRSRCPRAARWAWSASPGCGKSTTGRLITRLLHADRRVDDVRGPRPGQARQREMKPLRREVQMIFQDPYTSLNPRHTVGSIVGAPLRCTTIVPENQVLGRVQELLEVVGLNPEHYNRYPERVLRRPAPAHRHRPRADPQPQAAGRRRAGLRARRVDPGAGDQPAPGPAARVRASRSSSSPTTWRWCGTSAPRSR